MALAKELVNRGDFRAAYELCEREPVLEPADAASLDERIRGCLAIRLGYIAMGFELLERNRHAAITPLAVPMRYAFGVEPTQLERVARGLYDCLVAGIMPETIVGAASDFTTASTLSHARVLGWTLQREKRTSEAKIALDAYRTWRAAAVAERGERAAELIEDLREKLLRWKDKAGARELDDLAMR